MVGRGVRMSVTPNCVSGLHSSWQGLRAGSEGPSGLPLQGQSKQAKIWAWPSSLFPGTAWESGLTMSRLLGLPILSASPGPPKLGQMICMVPQPPFLLLPPACSCNLGGSVSEPCDPATGQCSCLPHVTGRDCGRCSPGFYDLQPGKGCQRWVG